MLTIANLNIIKRSVHAYVAGTSFLQSVVLCYLRVRPRLLVCVRLRDVVSVWSVCL